MNRTVIVTMVYGPAGEEMAKRSLPLMKLYAKKCWTELVVLTETVAEKHPVQYTHAVQWSLQDSMIDKMRQLQNLFEFHERILWLDLDILVRPDSPDIFQIVPSDHFAAYDGCSENSMQSVHYCHHRLKTVCIEEGEPVPETHGRYLNCGMFLIPRKHKFLLDPPKNYVTKHPWIDQDLINMRLCNNPSIPVYCLPEAFNRIVYSDYCPRRFDDMTWFIHYAGPPSYEIRLQHMDEQLERWEKYGITRNRKEQGQ